MADVSKQKHEIEVIFGVKLGYFGDDLFEPTVDIGRDKHFDISLLI